MVRPMWDDFEIAEPDDRWVLLNETGRDAVIAWFAGPENVSRVPRSGEGETVRVTVSRRGGADVRYEPLTDRDRATIEDSIDEYLADAGIPPRPQGYRWFLRVPAGCDSPGSFLSTLHQAINSDPPGISSVPRAWNPLIRRVVRGFYS
ncbi:DUF5956 family protein [Sinomonas sp. G460-2]|uniref:DUF5956 family protein n=1 Tax=Sinomonas sp. G460-2 TaxID=3393464 RepID=UPI0039EFF6E4